MPEIPVGAQIFGLAFHPKESLVYTGLLTGNIKAFRYDEQGQHESVFDLRPTKRSCRSLALNADGSLLYAVGRNKGMFVIDTATGKITETRSDIHKTAINQIKMTLPNIIATGDDDGVVKLWDPRTTEEIRSYKHHDDFISDFMWLETKRHLVMTSGDGTLSVVDVRSSKSKPVAHSEDQEDELLSIVPIRGGTKYVVGTQLGILSIFNRNSGWGDCVDRVPGHPQSIDALCNLPSYMPSAHSTILTGSSDGMLRAVQLFPTKLLGVVVDHGEFPIEKIAIDRGGEGRWIGSVGHEDVLRLTDLKDTFEDEAVNEGDVEQFTDDEEGGTLSSKDEDGEAEAKNPDAVDSEEDSDNSNLPEQSVPGPNKKVVDESGNQSGSEVGDKDGTDASDVDSDEPAVKKKRKKVHDPLAKERKDKKSKKGQAFADVDLSFFAAL